MQLDHHVSKGLLSSFCDGVSCTLDWLWTGYAVEGHHDLLIPRLHLSGVGIVGVHHPV